MNFFLLFALRVPWATTKLILFPNFTCLFLNIGEVAFLVKKLHHLLVHFFSFIFPSLFCLSWVPFYFLFFFPIVLSKINFKKKKNTHTHTHTINLFYLGCVCFSIKRNPKNILHHKVCLDWLGILVKQKMISVDCKIPSCDP